MFKSLKNPPGVCTFSPKILTHLGIPLVFLLGALLRTLNLISDKAFWDDELFSVLLARRPFWEVLYGAIVDVHPPGHLILLHTFYSVFGDADWVYRLPSVLAGCALIIVVFLLAREFFEKPPALLASFLVAISPYFIQLSNEARSYSLATLILTFMSYSFVKAFRTSEIRWSRAYLLSATLGVYVDHFAWIWLLMANFFLLGNKAFKKFLPTHLRIFFYGLPVLGLTIYQVFFSSVESVLHRQRLSLSYVAVVRKIFAVLWHGATGYGYSGWSKESLGVYSAEPLFWFALAAYVSFLIATVFAVPKARKDIRLFASLSSLAPMILLCVLFPRMLEARYVSFTVPPIFILAAAGFQQLRYGFVGLLPLVIVSFYFTFKTLTMPWDPIHRDDPREVIQYTFKLANENDAVTGLIRQVEYYGPKEKKTNYYRHLEDIPFNPRYARIFLLEPPLYVTPVKDRTRLDFAKTFLGRHGYALTESVDFTKGGVYTFVHIFEPKT